MGSCECDQQPYHEVRGVHEVVCARPWTAGGRIRITGPVTYISNAALGYLQSGEAAYIPQNVISKMVLSALAWN